MAIIIERVNAKGLGPLDEFTGQLGKFNLIYGRNEYGKTFLVEFILKSLFRDVRAFRLRSISPTGQVVVSGLEPGTSQFSPNARRKLEHYWEENVQGMPTNIAQLLVVKGAELDFTDKVPGGVSKKIVHSFLSSEGILDQIQEKIQSTVREARLENGEIIGPNRGELKNRDNTLAELQQIDKILEKVNQNYSGGSHIALLARKRELESKRSEQENAKRYLAYALDKSIQRYEEKNQSMEQKGLPELIKGYEAFIRKTEDLNKAKSKLEQLEEKSKHFQWFNIAINEYEKFLNQGSSGPKLTYYYLSALFIIGAAILTTVGFFTDQLNLVIYESVIFCGIGIVTAFGLVFGFLYYQQQQKSIRSLAQRHELKRIEAGFEDKFDEKLTNIAVLKQHFVDVQKAHHAAQAISEDINGIKAEIELIKERILHGMENLGINGNDESLWEEIIDRLKNAYQSSQDQIQSKRLELANLDVEQKQYLEVDPGIQYKKEELTSLTDAIEEIQGMIQDEEKNLELLKTEIRTAISDQTTASWEKLLENLNKRKSELIGYYKEITSKISAGILVSQVINDVRLQEDENLKASLHTPIVQKPLFEITKRYKEVTFDGENLIVSDGFEEYNIADLSTAAREQVLLALRLGFASKIMNQETAFLILDDAFQHSDWQRREYLLDAVVSLATKGWQVIYFSMDDHIRDLFNDIGAKTFHSDYHFYDLDNLV